MIINEIFYSIQGEGQWCGKPNIFIRTTGCNLRCSYCDTRYAYDEGSEKSISVILKEIQFFPCKKVCITGGEPLLQKDLKDLIEQLTEKKFQICLETNGSQSINDYIEYENVIVSMDIKTPSSNMSDKNNFDNTNKLRKHDQLKFILSGEEDYNFAKKIITDFSPICHIYLQPVWGSSIQDLAHWIIQDNLQINLGIQLHKIIWGNRKGV